MSLGPYCFCVRRDLHGSPGEPVQQNGSGDHAEAERGATATSERFGQTLPAHLMQKNPIREFFATDAGIRTNIDSTSVSPYNIFSRSMINGWYNQWRSEMSKLVLNDRGRV